MNVDRILEVLHDQKVDYLLIGGMNFMLRHLPLATFDVDIWIDDVPANRVRCARALAQLLAAWGPTEDAWGPVNGNDAAWLETQAVFCMTTPFGALDVFRQVSGLPAWADCRKRAVTATTGGNVPFLGLSDADMLRCQYALPEGLRRLDRIRHLENLPDASRGERP